MAGQDNWKLEAWKAMISFTEKLFFIILAALLIPALIEKVRYPLIVLVIGILGVLVSGGVWLILVLRGYRKEG